MKLHNLTNRSREGYTTFGSVWNRQEAGENTVFELKNEQGVRVPVQTRVTAWWPDGSIKWAAHTADAGLMGPQAEIKAVPEADYSAFNGENCIQVNREKNGYGISTGKLRLFIPEAGTGMGENLAEDVCFQGSLRVRRIYPVLQLERKKEQGNRKVSEVIPFRGLVSEVAVEEQGPLQCVIRFQGSHKEEGGEELLMPFVIRMYLWAGSDEIRFVHTFFYDGKEERDYLKAMGLRLETAMEGRPYERHVKFGTDQNCFHEAAVILNSSHPRLLNDVLEKQMRGEMEEYDGDSLVEEACRNLPVWNRYSICQDSPSHFQIRKRTSGECCELTCMQGHRAPGTMAVNSRNGGVLIGSKDFWQKYPAGLDAERLGRDFADCTVWFHSPEAESFDFRHYDTRSYPMTSYEGFEEVGASAFGISVTSECMVKITDHVPEDGELEGFAGKVQKPPVYVGAPEYYHGKKALGYWSLPSRATEVESWVEDQLEKAASFYENQVEDRNWYGLFDYGDFMHTYDPVRHCWRYDMGGFAWQNTELVPTYWLWLYFLRTGREDVYCMAEAMSRHCSEVDYYHFGPMKGIGSRHNVRHWGCSCKEPRVSMAGHHRFLYYLTGDYRIGDCMEDSKDADLSMKNLPHYRVDAEDDTTKEFFVRSGPDWSSFVSDWMTQYERTLDEGYGNKIREGFGDLKKMPLGLASGPEFGYVEETGHLVYKGEQDHAGNMHLQVCMGGPEVWLETADMLEDGAFRKLLAEYGRFYLLSQQDKEKESGGLLVERSFGFPFFAAGLSAFSAAELADQELAGKVVKELLHALANEEDTDGFTTCCYAVRKDGAELKEIPWIKTNFTAQWCLNTIMALDFIRESLPGTMEQLKTLLARMEQEDFHRA